MKYTRIRAKTLRTRTQKNARTRGRIEYTHTRIQVKAPKISLDRLTSCYAGEIFHRKRCRRRTNKGKGAWAAETEGKKFGLKPIFFCKNFVKTLDNILLNEYNKRKIIIKEQGKMKEFIEKSGLTTAQFAKKYDIPYNTVRQWAEGIRKAPEWLVRLFESEQAYKPLIEEKEENTSLITEEGIRRTISIFEYIIYFKGQSGAFIKVPVDMLVEQIKGITKKLKEEV